MTTADFLKNYTFCFLDVETTGLDPDYGDRICEVAIEKVRKGKILQSFDTLVNPQRAISSGAFAINGITKKMLKGKSLFEEIAQEVLEILKGSIIVCHNVPFDMGFLDAEFERITINLPEFTIIDTLLLARRCFRFRRNNLGNVARVLGIEVKDAHRAMADVKTTQHIFSHFVSNFWWRGVRNLEEILALQDAPDIRTFKKRYALPPHLEEAVSSQKDIRIKYTSAFGDTTERVVRPKEIAAQHDYLYLVAHCYLREAERNFRLDRIVEMEIVE